MASDKNFDVSMSDDEWKKKLTPEQYQVLRKHGTERAGTSPLDHHYEPGTYFCAGCGAPLFDSDTKFNSGSGWPSFYQALDPDKVELHDDNAFGMRRTEVICSKCESHLGHVFPDGPKPTGMRFCINSASLKHDEKK